MTASAHLVILDQSVLLLAPRQKDSQSLMPLRKVLHNMPITWRSRDSDSVSFISHKNVSKRVTCHCRLLNATSHFYSSFSWTIGQEVLFRWFPLFRKPLHLLHPGHGKVAAWSPSAAGESCLSVRPRGIILISPVHADIEHQVCNALVI